jgi:hypothetical protein
MITPRQLEWVAGFLEGEGTFRFDRTEVKVSAPQVNPLPIDRLTKLFGGARRLRQEATRKGQPINEWTLCGVAAAGLMMTLYPLVLQKREQILKALTEWRRRPIANRYRTTCRVGHVLGRRRLVRDNRRGGLVQQRKCDMCQRDWIRRFRERARQDIRTGDLFSAAR